MPPEECYKDMEWIRKNYEDKFLPEEQIFSRIHPGDQIFVGTACGEPQHLVRALVEYVRSNPKAFFDAEILQVVTLGVAPYMDEKFKKNFRHNLFFIGNNTRTAVNQGLADYSPVFLSQVPKLFFRKLQPVDVAMVQVSPPDRHGYVSLGVSLDITRAAVENAQLVIAQMNVHTPRVHGDTFLHLRDIDFIVHHDEPLLEYDAKVPDEIADRIGQYVARIVEDGDTLQVGYGSLPNAILAHLRGKRHLGIHTELLTDGVVQLMKEGVVDNSQKTLLRGKTVATFCMGKKETYEYLHDNPGIEFRTIDFTNNPLTIARNRCMTAINSALQVDLTGQSTAESIGRNFYSGIGGQADFMRGAVLSPGGKTILAIQSTAEDGEVSRIVPFLHEGAGVTLTRGDVHYVVSEYGIAYLHGKNIRERAMDLIAISHPKFQPWLIEEAKRARLIYRDQAFIPGKRGEYPEALETYRTTKAGQNVLLRPVKISDESLLKDFFYSLSERTIYYRFISVRKDMPHERLQEFVVIDYTKRMVILVVARDAEKEEIVGVGQYDISEDAHTADAALVIRDDDQNQGIGHHLLAYLTILARKQGLLAFTASVLMENKAMLHLLQKVGFDIRKRGEGGVYEMRLAFRAIE
jgi:acyl-CoA hydrolase/ribosomal protein S18 acetylase RimI-like enzyme